eukprot:TRINITY_DN13262_c0_g1_i1.p1 TRINITY_DN13262_c0_g1~~TRINITY_DN13262_c0_g1_i1.p1  ORF type:complete len:101 (+),score=30.42 TRINITY_DN13262_c0_g1_i1:82-384(+)
MKRRPPRSTQSRSSAASDVYKRQLPQRDLCPGKRTAKRLGQKGGEGARSAIVAVSLHFQMTDVQHIRAGGECQGKCDQQQNPGDGSPSHQSAPCAAPGPR